MSSLTGNKKLLIPVFLVAAFAVASLAIMTTPTAFAQGVTNQENNTAASDQNATSAQNVPSDQNATSNENATATGAEQNATEQTSAQFTGTIRVSPNATADQFSEQSLNVTADNATAIARSQVFNGTAIDTHLAVIHNFLVYSVTLADTHNNNIRMVIVDAGNGSVLFASAPIPVESSQIASAIESQGGEGGGGGGEGSNNG
jgi:uncharacterized membrane protein YkoI